MLSLYTDTAFECSKLITKAYSTSFSMGISMFHRKFHLPIYAIYGFVRYADEIVDTFHKHDKAELLQKFTDDTYEAIEQKISLNPVLHSFQQVVNEYHIERELIAGFLKSMEMDLDKTKYVDEDYNTYIYGSAEVVGLMCLRIFCEKNEEKYQQLVPSARHLGAAFQKVNFLRDIKSDYEERGRVYFPGVDYEKFLDTDKKAIEEDIKQDFSKALEGIKKLPKGARAGVYLAYIYYSVLLKKITALPATRVKTERIRVPDFQKILLMIKCTAYNKLGVIV